MLVVVLDCYPQQTDHDDEDDWKRWEEGRIEDEHDNEDEHDWGGGGPS